MRSLFVFWVQFLIFSLASASPHPRSIKPGQQTTATSSSTAGTDALAATGLRKLQAYSKQQLDSDCNQSNLAIRKEWGTLPEAERKAYTDAVLCLMSKPAKTDAAAVPGAKSRYDDFLFTHINQTLAIHGTATFLTWHRFYTWTFEQALRNECDYDGYQPYWNWGKWAADPVNSPIFDGSDFSMSGNGVFQAHNATNALPTGLNPIPPGSGGGCLASGPFKDSKVNLGPVAPTLMEADVVANNGTIYNPRCIKRDISSWVSQRFTSDANSTDLIKNSKDIGTFQTSMQGDFAKGEYGVHTGGHFTIAGDPGGDLFSSPGDPAFYLHHAQIDRTYWIWQNQDLAARQNAIAGTITLNNMPPSRNGTLDDLIDLGVNAAGVPMKTLMSTTGGPFCYMYM